MASFRILLPLLKMSTQYPSHRALPSNVLSNKNADLLFCSLFEIGESSDIKRVEQWATKV